ncbi:MAG TPA: 50S ribosomal protein L21e [Euryarchaeota archaeon]|nr:50S ribosomal protein L21e [Euryarchaeota archaeon]
MVRKTSGLHRKTRHKLRKWRSKTPPVTVSRMLQSFSIGERVVVDIHPSVQDGRPHPRFNGRVGVVVGRQGEGYKVLIRDGNAEKTLVSLPIHLKRVA